MIVRPSPSTVKTKSLSAAERIDTICDAFEDAWRSGPRPAIAPYLSQSIPAERRQLFRELLSLDIEYRRRQGETVGPADYLAELPDFSEEIHALVLTTDEPHGATRALDDGADGGGATVAAPNGQLAQFRLIERLGSGGSGEVWKAWDARLCRHIALKLLRDPRPGGSQRQRFLREARAAARLRHENIVPVYEIDKHAGTVFIVEELIEGEDLGKQCRAGPLAPRDAARIGAAVADAIGAAHEAGIVHRDLKPANILMDRAGKPFVADFGVAKWADDAGQVTITGEIIGTPAYMAPEQACGDVSAVDARTDVYALGAVLYQLLTGQAPFAGDHVAVLQAVIEDEPPAPRKLRAAIPRDLETICLRAMQKDPSQRYATAAALRDDLRRYLAGEPVQARRVGTVAKLWRTARRRPAATLAGGCLLLLLGACGFALSLANENRTLTGIQTVKLATEPPGADVTFIPLSGVTGAPQADKLLRLGLSPIAEQLTPGDYLVVAVLPDGRFHEVFRRVPEPGRQQPARYRHLRWDVDHRGHTVLPAIHIPEQNISDGMALISSRPIDLVWREHPRQPKEVRNVPAFHCDPFEITVGEYRKRIDPFVLDSRTVERPDEFAMTFTYDEAVEWAELCGKRLPSMEELQRLEYLPRPSSEQATTVPGDIGPVGTPATDWVETTPPVFGTRSNVAEWTTSLPFMLGADESTKDFTGFQMADYRFIKGGLIDAADRPPGAVAPMASRYRLSPDLGMRCVRSVKPRLSPADFVVVLERSQRQVVVSDIWEQP